MVDKDPLLNVMYRRNFFEGTFFDDINVGRAAEFDLDIILDLPSESLPVLSESNIPGYVHVYVTNFEGFMKQPEATPAYLNFRTLFDDDFYVTTEKTMAWMQGVVQKTLNDLPFREGAHLLQNDIGIFEIRVKKAKRPPAMSLRISGEGLNMDVNLVSCFVFRGNCWPVRGYRSNPYPNNWPSFFVVSKMPKYGQTQPTERYWRLSFEEQERALLNNKRNLKPAVKLLTKLHNTLEHNDIAGYYIKTVFLHAIAQQEDDFWGKSLSQVFMTVLETYRDYITNGNIPYYWNSNYNLIERMKAATRQNICQTLASIVEDIENNRDRPETVARYLLTSQEYEAFLFKYNQYRCSGYPDVIEDDVRHPEARCVIT